MPLYGQNVLLQFYGTVIVCCFIASNADSKPPIAVVDKYQDPNVTPALLNTAINRATVLRQLEVNMLYPMMFNIAGVRNQSIEQQSANINQQLGELRNQMQQVSQHLQRTDRELERQKAHAENFRILMYNRLVGVELGFKPRLKEVPGLGLDLALERAGIAVPAQLFQQQAMIAAGQPVPIPNVGEAPPFWSRDLAIDKFSDEHILMLISFYNEDFGIKAVDGLGVRIKKFRSWFMAL